MRTELAAFDDVLKAATHPRTPIATENRKPLLALENVI